VCKVKRGKSRLTGPLFLPAEGAVKLVRVLYAQDSDFWAATANLNLSEIESSAEAAADVASLQAEGDVVTAITEETQEKLTLISTTQLLGELTAVRNA
jgi:hypothetical protein